MRRVVERVDVPNRAPVEDTPPREVPGLNQEDTSSRTGTAINRVNPVEAIGPFGQKVTLLRSTKGEPRGHAREARHHAS